MCGEVELTTLNKALLGRQPKLCDVFLLLFHSLVSFKFVSFCFVLVLIISCLFDLGLFVFNLKF